MTIRKDSLRRSAILAAAIVLCAAAAGCAGTGQRSSQDLSASQSPEALCRQAIADVTKHCKAEDGNPRLCEAAKARSREACI